MAIPDIGSGLNHANAGSYSPYQELGRTGLQAYAGQIFEEILPELRGYRWDKTVLSMINNDPVVGAFLYAIEMLIRQTTWTIEASSDSDTADQANAEFVRECMFEDLSYTWQDVLSEIVSFLPWGWSFLEKVFKRRLGSDPGTYIADNGKERQLPTSRFNDGRIGWRKWSIRAQETRLRWEFDDEGGIDALTQLPPPDFGLRTIPIYKALLFRTTTRKGNPEGYSVLRRAYLPWYYKTNIGRIEAIGIERDMAGVPIAGIPAELFGSDLSANQQAVYDAWKKIVTSLKRDEEEGILYPLAYDESGKELYKLSLMTTGGTRQFNTTEVIERYDQRILMSVMADFMMLGHSKGGTQALVRERTNLFSIALGAWLDAICSVVNRWAIPELLDLNGIKYTDTPKLVHGDVEAVDIADLADYILKLSQAGFDLAKYPDLEKHLLEQAKLPTAQESA